MAIVCNPRHNKLGKNINSSLLLENINVKCNAMTVSGII
jgi:hypothetical protein